MMSIHPPSIGSVFFVATLWALSLLLERRIGPRCRDVARTYVLSFFHASLRCGW
jgi:hypothetical protein